jgi:hypothetical protein
MVVVGKKVGGGGGSPGEHPEVDEFVSLGARGALDFLASRRVVECYNPTHKK